MTNPSPIAIVGIAAMFPQAINAETFWQNILTEKDCITEIPSSHWLIEDYFHPNPQHLDKTHSKRGGFLPNVEFDPLEFGIPPSIIPVTDTAQLLALILAKQVLQEATLNQLETADLSQTSVILGVIGTTELTASMAGRIQRPIWAKALRESGMPESKIDYVCDRIADHFTPWQENTFPGLLGNVIAGRIANRFNLGGTNCIIDAACASSLAALNSAVSELQLHRSNLVITGGVDAGNDILMYMCFNKTTALSKSDRCQPFSDQADGTLLGEGLCMLALKRLEDAERDGNKIYAVVKGIGTSSDGKSKSVYAPVSKGQALAIQRAHSIAGFTPQSVELIEAHGTGTKAGDLAELNGLNLVFQNNGLPSWCALGSIKSQIGHTKAAAGAAGLFKAIMGLQHKILPPTIKINNPNPNFDIDNSPFYLNVHPRPWIRSQEHPRRAGVSAFGFGGANYHVCLEEYAQNASLKPLRFPISTALLFVHSAKSSQDLIQKLQTLSKELQETKDSLAAFSKKSQLAPVSGSIRLAIVAESFEDYRSKILQALERLKKQANESWTLAESIYFSPTHTSGKLAFIFPGQGSQYLNMGADLAINFEQARTAWDDAANISFVGKQKLHDIVFPPKKFSKDAEKKQTQLLMETQWTQPAIATASLAQLSILNALNINADLVAGHSLGEVTALYAGGAYNRVNFLNIVQKRATAMHEVSTRTQSGMLAVQYDLQTALDLLTQQNIDISVANYNSPNQWVLSGSIQSISAAENLLKQSKIPCKRLNVSGGFHSGWVSKATEQFKQDLNHIDCKAPSLPVFSNTFATLYPSDPKKIKDLLANQLSEPVKFQEMLDAMYEFGARIFLEVGPNKILTHLVKQCLNAKPHLAIHLDCKEKSSTQTFLQGIAQLFVAGVSINFEALWLDINTSTPYNLSTKRAHTVTINGANYAKPYPTNRLRSLAVHQYEEINVSQQNHHSNDHLTLLAQLQQQMSDAHNQYQQSMANSHLAYLNTIQTSIAALSGQALAAQPLNIPQPVAQTPIATTSIAPNKPQMNFSAPSAPLAKPQPLVPPSPSAPAELFSPPTPEKPGNIAPPAIDQLQTVMLKIVADKTGYPSEMLGMDMQLEADLGIDSIKRVEILSAIQQEVPGLPELDPSELANLKTLGEIATYMEKKN